MQVSLPICVACAIKFWFLCKQLEYRCSSECEWLHLELKAHDSLLVTLENSFAGVILRPGYIYGTRPIGPLKIPFGRMWTPFEMVQPITYWIHFAEKQDFTT